MDEPLRLNTTINDKLFNLPATTFDYPTGFDMSAWNTVRVEKWTLDKVDSKTKTHSQKSC